MHEDSFLACSNSTPEKAASLNLLISSSSIGASFSGSSSIGASFSEIKLLRVGVTLG